MGTFEEQYLDVLQNVEAMIVMVYQEHPKLTDNDVERALDALIRAYRHPDRPVPSLGDLSAEVFDAVQSICEVRMGRASLQLEDGTPFELDTKPLNTEEMLAVLRRVRKSVRKWNKKMGRRGYLRFVQQFIR